MKTLIFTISLFCCFSICGQDNESKFLRVFDLEGKKIAKGKVHSISDTVLTLKLRQIFREVEVKNIGTIKTKRSVGNSVGIGAIGGASLGILIGAVASDEYDFLSSTAQTAGLGIFGTILGAVGGGVTGLSKKSITYPINGDILKWQEFTKAIGN